MKTAIILNGSPRRQGNTAVLVGWLQDALREHGWQFATHNLYQLNFKGCAHCDACRKNATAHGCVLRDDFISILDAISNVQLMIIASPVYCWCVSGCTAAALDRFYALLKDEEGGSLLAGKKFLGAFTSGGDMFEGMELCATMLKNLCRYAGATYAGTIAAHSSTTPQELLTRIALHDEIFAQIAKM